MESEFKVSQVFGSCTWSYQLENSKVDLYLPNWFDSWSNLLLQTKGLSCGTPEPDSSREIRGQSRWTRLFLNVSGTIILGTYEKRGWSEGCWSENSCATQKPPSPLKSPERIRSYAEIFTLYWRQRPKNVPQFGGPTNKPSDVHCLKRIKQPKVHFLFQENSFEAQTQSQRPLPAYYLLHELSNSLRGNFKFLIRLMCMFLTVGGKQRKKPTQFQIQHDSSLTEIP